MEYPFSAKHEQEALITGESEMNTGNKQLY